MKKTMFTLFMLVFGLSAAMAQRSISGTVVDSKSDPLIGASILIKGTSSGTVTDVNGAFQMNVPEGSVLVVSYTGYVSQSITLGASNTMVITLQADQRLLDEVVVTAFGIERKRNDLSVSAQKVTGEEVNQVRSNNFVNALSGKVAGLDIRTNNNMGGSTNVVLRGTKSITGNNQALFVVDGVPISNATLNTGNTSTGREGYDYGSAAADINPDDIDQITVLKGAAAALYGSRGANGVVLITTKKGRKDRFSVTVNTGLTFGKIDKTTFITHQKEYGAGYGQDFYDYEPNPGFLSSDLFTPGVQAPFVPFTEDGSMGAKFDPNLQVYDWKSIDSKSPSFGKTTAWVAAKNDVSEFFETAVSSNQSVSIEGGSNTALFKLGYTRNDEKGMLPNSNLAKNIINVGATIEPTDKFKISTSMNFTNQSATGRYGSGYGSKNLNTMFRQWWQTNIDILEQKEAYERFEQNATWNPAGVAIDASPIYWDNPYFSRYKNYQNDSRNRFFGNVQAQYKILPSLSLVGRVGGDMAFDQQQERINKKGVDRGAYSIFNRNNKEFNYDAYLNYNKDLSSDLNLNVAVGTNIRRSYLSSIFSTTNTDLVVDGLYSIGNSAGTPVPPVEVYQPIGVDGLFGTASLSFKDMFFLDGTIRRDQSTTLPEANNTYIYPSVSAGFSFAEVLKQDWLSYGKIRASYAQVGNDAPALSIYSVYDKPTAFGSIPFFSLPGTRNNIDLKPERTKSTEFGLDMAFMDNRFGFEFTYYNASTFDQIIPIQITGATGYTSKFINSGEVVNKGIEVIANITPVRTQDFTWGLSFNFSKNNNEVISLFDENTKQIVIATFQSGVSLVALPGQPMGTLKGTGFVYKDGKRTVNEDGYYVTAKDQVIGNTTQKWFGGVGTTLTYKNIKLGMLVDAKIGGSIYSLDQAYGQYTGQTENTAGLNDLGNPKRDPVTNDAKSGGVILDGVKADGTPNDVRVSVQNANDTPFGIANNPNEAFIYDATYVKLREVNLTYSFNKNLFGTKSFIKGVDVSLVGRNLWIIHKNLPDADPEEVYGAGNISGHQGGAYPTLKTIGFNVKLSF